MTASRRWWVFALVSLALFMGMLDNLVVTTALPAIQRSLHANLLELEWTVNAYTLVFTILMVPAAALGDRFGHRRVLLIGVLLFTLGSVGAALSKTALQLALVRGLQGVGGALITPMTLTILTRAFPAEQRGLIIGLWSGVSGLGLALGPLIGGAVVSGWDWSAVFWINVPVGIILLFLGWIRLPETYGERNRLDLLGMLLVGPGLLGVVLGLSSGNSIGWTSTPVIGMLVLGTLFLLAFLFWERVAAAPMIDLRLFRNRPFRLANGISLLMQFGAFGSIFFLTQFLQDVLKGTPLIAGLETMPWTVAIMLVSPLTGLIVSRLGTRLVLLTGMLAQSVALIWIGAVASATISYSQIFLPFVLAGIGMGLVLGPASTTVVNAVTQVQQAQASGILSTLRQLGGVFGIALLGIVFELNAPTHAQFLTGFRAILFAGAGVIFVGGLLALLLPSLNGRTQRGGLVAEIEQEVDTIIS